MRKQTKLVAVASAAALLAIGASMTSFAATGWVEEDGVWYYYDKDGNKVEDDWKKSGDNWYWLDSEEAGAMAVDKLIEDDDDLYYVDANGVMVTNTWVKVVNEDQDDEDDPAEYNYYYMQSNGKAYKAPADSHTKFKSIDGKKYAFDEDGKMLYGWLNEDSTRATDDSDWENATYYCGSWEDGALKTGWQKIEVYDELEDEDMEHWFNFKSNGKKRAADEDEITEKKINGKRYGFDERGVMTYEWTLFDTASQGSTTGWKYFSDPEDGARKTKGWFKVVAPTEDNDFASVIDGAPTTSNTFSKGKAEDETEKWYYANGEGELVAGQIKKINGKYYGFHKEGWMLNGLVAMEVDNSGMIVDMVDDGVDSDDLDKIMDSDPDKATEMRGCSLYYFGNNEDEDGTLKTGSTTVTLDGESYQFLFSKTGGVEGKGKGVTGIDDEKYIYKYGMKIKADSDEKYIVVEATGDIADTTAEVKEIETIDMRKSAEVAGQNKDGDTVKAYTSYADSANVYLVGTSGAIVKNKTAAKDGDDWYFYVDDKRVKMYTNNKTLPDGLKDWKN